MLRNWLYMQLSLLCSLGVLVVNTLGLEKFVHSFENKCEWHIDRFVQLRNLMVHVVVPSTSLEMRIIQ